jgi:hypothetical protein
LTAARAGYCPRLDQQLKLGTLLASHIDDGDNARLGQNYVPGFSSIRDRRQAGLPSATGGGRLVMICTELAIELFEHRLHADRPQHAHHLHLPM